MYSGAYDVCVATLRVYPHRASLKNMPGHGRIPLWPGMFFKLARCGYTLRVATHTSYLDMLDIVRGFLKAERTGNWEMHMQAVSQMLPYFAASGHNHYTQNASLYLQSMKNLKVEHSDVYEAFASGYHVVRRSDRYWASLSTDLIIEQVLMRISLKTTGGLTRGSGMTEQKRVTWLLLYQPLPVLRQVVRCKTMLAFNVSAATKVKICQKQDKI